MFYATETCSPMPKVGELLRELMRRRAISGVDLAAQVELSPTALSQILNGVTNPRQTTFARLMQRLAQTEEERNALLEAYTGMDPLGAAMKMRIPPGMLIDTPGLDTPDASIAPTAPAVDEEESARYMEAKSHSIAFEADVKHLLDEARILHTHPFNIPGKIAVDFVTRGKTKIALECKSNLTRDWDRVLGTCLLVKRNLPVDTVVLVIPYHNATSKSYEPDFEAHGIYMETPATLIARLKELGA